MDIYEWSSYWKQNILPYVDHNTSFSEKKNAPLIRYISWSNQVLVDNEDNVGTPQ